VKVTSPRQRSVCGSGLPSPADFDEIGLELSEVLNRFSPMNND